MAWSNASYATYTNLLATTTFTSGYLSDSGVLAAADANNMTSGYVAVSPGTTYTYACGGYSGSKSDWTGYFFYKNNSGTVSSVTSSRQTREASSTTGHSFSFTTPSDCYYIRIGSRSLSLAGAWVAMVRGSATVTKQTFLDGSNATVATTVGSSNTFTPNATQGWYTITSFTAPANGVYRFQLYGSGGSSNAANGGSAGTPGKGGYTDGFLSMKQGDTVYIGAGAAAKAAFVAKAANTALSGISAANLYFVAGAGGGNGAAWGSSSVNHYGGNGGDGGGASGGSAPSVGNAPGGGGGTQTAGGTGGNDWESYYGGRPGSYGAGGAGGYTNIDDTSQMRGNGGDGYYGGGGGGSVARHGAGGGGGSGYIHTPSVTVASTTYTNTTTQGGGAAANSLGSVKVTYYALDVLPVIHNGTRLTKIIYNGTEVKSLIYNGTKLY